MKNKELIEGEVFNPDEFCAYQEKFQDEGERSRKKLIKPITLEKLFIGGQTLTG